MSSIESQQSTVKPSRCRLCLSSSAFYFRDALLTVTAMAASVLIRLNGPVSPGFFCHDPDITHPYLGDSVSFGVLFVMTVLVPLVVVGSVELVQQRGGWAWTWKRPLWVTCVLNMRHLVCQAFLFAVTELIKSLVARPRPCFLALCAPTGYNQTLCDTRSFISEFECGRMSEVTSKEEKLLIMDSMLSFPSGHATVATCTAVFLAIYLTARSREWPGSVPRMSLMAACAVYAAGISFSRVSDHRHHLTDVLAGILLGALAGVALSYGACADKLFRRSAERPALLAQTSVLTNRTQGTSVDGDL